MDQDPSPQDRPAQTPNDTTPAAPAQSGAGHVDIGKILLPKKEAPGTTTQSAQRINAGALLAQEQTAAAEGIPKAPEEAKPVVQTPASAPTGPKKEESLVKPLETYRGDIEQLVQNKNVSMLSIAAAEAERRAGAKTTPEEAAAARKNILSGMRTTAMVVGGIAFIGVAAGLVAYLFLRTSTTPIPQTLQAPFISVDETAAITVSPGESHGDLMNSLTSIQKSVSLSLGLIERELPVTASSTASGQMAPMDAQPFLTALSPSIPQSLLLTIQPQYLLGIHVYDGNQAFLILKVDSYEQGYAGMLAWESTMYNDLLPLFIYTPPQHIPEEGVATSTPNSPQFIQTGFTDSIVENHDARVIENSTGDIIFLWTFLDRNTIVITTNDATLREIISRLQNAPVTPIPGQ